MELLRESYLLVKKVVWMGETRESRKYANHILPVLLSICFTCMFKHCYLPISMLDSVIVPLLKKRNGDLSYKNNYRSIAYSVISKVFEHVILYIDWKSIFGLQTTNLGIKLAILPIYVYIH